MRFSKFTDVKQLDFLKLVHPGSFFKWILFRGFEQINAVDAVNISFSQSEVDLLE